jgi:glycosyltransferase involved in cell wall biosynthesis
MKICLVAPGFLPIPTTGWGAIENIIWDYKEILERYSHEVFIVNEIDEKKTLDIINYINPDICHCHYDQYIDVLKACKCKIKIISTHYGMIRKCLYHKDGELEKKLLNIVFPKFKDENIYIFALDKYIYDFFINNYNISSDKIKIIPNGSRDDLFCFKDTPDSNNSICVGKIDQRKRQRLLKNLDVLLIGNIGYEDELNFINKNKLKGEWNRECLYKNLTNNANLVLLSYSEAAPLVTVESLMSGLGLVISEACDANLDTNLPFIDIIPEKYINDEYYLDFIINRNKKISMNMRKDIRNYAVNTFSLEHIIKNIYLKEIESIVSNSG